jgi:hypothetical protein
MAVQTKATIHSTIDANINDNSSGDISPADVREPFEDIVDSFAALQEDLGKGTGVALAGTMSFGVGQLFHITAGTGPITDIDFATPWDGRFAILIADVAFTVTHNATTLVLPGGADLSVAVGDRLLIAQDNSDNIYVIAHVRADALVDATKLTGTVPNANLPTRLQAGSATIVDANNALTSGFYDMASGGSNVPETSAYNLLVIALDSDNVTQIAVAHASQRSWIRRRVSGTFGAWTVVGGQTPGRSFAGTTDTLVLTDAGGRVRSTGGSPATITIPPNSDVPIPVDHFVTILQYGTGQVTIAPGSGVTLRTEGGKLKSLAQYTYIVLDKVDTNEWVVGGSVTL